METAEEREAGLLHKILPPRLEDAGLEDCALPPDSISEAFFKAATAIKSRAASIFTTAGEEETVRYSEGDCVQDPRPGPVKGTPDTVIGALPEHDSPGSCATEKGSALPHFGGDDVVVGGEADADVEEGDKLVMGGDEIAGRKACVEGLQGLEIGEKVNKGGVDDEEDEKEDEEKPRLTEGYV